MLQRTPREKVGMTEGNSAGADVLGPSASSHLHVLGNFPNNKFKNIHMGNNIQRKFAEGLVCARTLLGTCQFTQKQETRAEPGGRL